MTFWTAPLANAPVSGPVCVPASKSATARALVLSAIADRPSKLSGVLRSRDSDLMRAGLTKLGATFTEVPGEDTVEVTPVSDWLGGSTIDVGLSGTVLRFLPPLAALAAEPTRFVGDPEVAFRPIQPLLHVLEHLGATIMGPTVPFTVAGGSAVVGSPDSIFVDARTSSQFLSAMLLAAPAYPNGLTVETDDGLPSWPHVAMTLQMLRDWGGKVNQLDELKWQIAPGNIRGQSFRIEPDLTNACVFLAAALVTGGSVTVNWPRDNRQASAALLDTLTAFGGQVVQTDTEVTLTGPTTLTGVELDLSQVSEMTCLVAAIACLANRPSTITDVGHIRGHETDRLAALTIELSALGAEVTETRTGLEIHPKPLAATRVFQTYADHRMAHAAAILGLVTEIEVADVACTSKTMPTFVAQWEKLIGRNCG